MASIVIAGDVSGTCTLLAANAAGNTVLNLPTTSGTLLATGSSPSFTTITTTSDANISGLTVGKGGGSQTTNTVVGNGALNAVNSGVGHNTAIGFQAINANTTGTNLDAVGAYVLNKNTTGIVNTAMGGSNTIPALYNNTTGSYNVAYGVGSLFSNTTASNNTAVGYQAGYSNTVATHNTFIGWQAGYSYNGTGGTYNTFIGTQAGQNQTSGQYNTYVGIQSGLSMTTGARNTILGGYTGNNGGLDIRTASNYIVLSDGDGNPRQVIDNNATSKLKQYLLFNGQKNAVPSGSATNLFRITSPTGQIYGPLMIQFAYDQPGVNLYAGTITGRAFWNGSTALYDNTTTTGNTVTWSVTGSGNDLTFRVTQGTGANVNFSYTVIWTQYQTGGLTGVDTTTIVGL